MVTGLPRYPLRDDIGPSFPYSNIWLLGYEADSVDDSRAAAFQGQGWCSAVSWSPDGQVCKIQRSRAALRVQAETFKP